MIEGEKVGETRRRSGWSSSPLSLQRRRELDWLDPAENGTTSGFGSSFSSRYLRWRTIMGTRFDFNLSDYG